MKRKTIQTKIIILFFLINLMVASCSSIEGATLSAPQSLDLTNDRALTRTANTNVATNTNTPETILTSTSTPIPPQITRTQTPTPTSTWVYNEPGNVNVPILLYHHIEDNPTASRYSVSITDFHSQMKALYDSGYKTIPISLFLDALLKGADLPEKAVVITFDDGHQSVYDNAFPIMQAFGFTGVAYVVANRINDIPDFLNIATLKEMIAAGWEVGSHSYTHVDLTVNHQRVSQEIAYSKIDLEKALSIKVQTFAYPFGLMDSYLAQKVSQYGYRAGMGLGTRKTHTVSNLFYLDRIEIYGDLSLDDFRQIFIDY